MVQFEKFLTLPRLFALTLALALGVLSVQLPFLYYSDDIVFHAAKIMAAQSGDFFTDPVSGFKTIYPPFFHIISGTMARVLGLDTFWTSRIVQLWIFAGMVLSAFLFFRTITGSREKGALGGLCLALLFYAPTGKYFLLSNPTNFSTLFVLFGAALIFRCFNSGKLRDGIIGAVIAGVGINIWWWNVIPVFGLMLGIIISFAFQKKLTSELKNLSAVAVTFAVVLSLSLWPLYEIRDILDNYNYDIENESYAAGKSTFEIVGNWIYWFLLKGNQQFFKYLVPATMSSSDKIVFLYGIIASVYFYLLVLPFNYLMLFISTKTTFAKSADNRPNIYRVLFMAAVTVFILSIVSLYRTDLSVMRRIQFYVFIFMLPGFLYYLYDKFGLEKKTKFKYALAIVCSFSMLYSVFYRNEIVLSNPRPAETTALVEFVKSIPDYPETRFFVSEFDNHLLLREMRYHSFVLRGNPIYFRQDKRQADSIFAAYNKIIACGDSTLPALREFNTQYAIIGKSDFNISPIRTKVTANELSDKMTAYFKSFCPVIFENSQWVVFKIDLYPNMIGR